MPKSTLSFNLPEEQEEFETAVNASNYRCILSEIDMYLRNRIKHEDLEEKVVEALQDTRDRLHSIGNEYLNGGSF